MANGSLLGAIINPAQADVSGAFEQRRQGQARDLAGDILGNTFTGQLGKLAKIDPDTAINLSQAVGIPLDSKGRLENFMGTAVAANQLVKAGLQQEAVQFITEQAQKIESVAGPGAAGRMMDMATRLQAGDPQAFEQLNQLATAFSPQVSAKEQAETGKLQAETAKIRKEISKPEDLPGKIEFKEFRTLNNDVTGLIKEPLKIRRAADRLTKLGLKKSPTDQLAAIFTFMKALDPASVVREGEQQAARATGGPADQFIGFINQAKGEGGLTETVFNQMIATAQSLADQAVTGARDELTSSLDAFGNRLRSEDKDKLLNRIPDVFTPNPLSLLPEGTKDNNDGTFTLPNGDVVRAKRGNP